MELTLDQVLQKGIEAHKAGQAQEADRLYSAILIAQPKHPDTNHNMGVLAVGVGKVQEALPFFKTALEANPSTVQFWLSYIEALIKLDQFAEAKAVFDQAKSNGARGDGFDKLKQRLSAQDEEPTETSNAAREEDQEQSNTLSSLELDRAIKLAKTKVKEGSSEEAKLIYQDILAKFPKNKRASYGLKTLVDGPVGKASKVQEPPQDQLQSLINLYQQGQLQQVLKQTEALVQQFLKSPILYHIQGTVLKSLEQLDLSIEAYNKALVIKPDYTDAYYNMGVALKAQGKLEKAIEAYNKALAIKPDNAEAYNNMGVALKAQGKLKQAIEAYNKALAIKPDFTDAYYNSGNTLLEQGKLEDAIEAYNNALTLKPDYAEAYYNRGNALKEQGKQDEAIDSYSKALALEPDYADAYHNMGATFQDQGKLEAAIEAYNKALAKTPDNADAHNNIGNALRDQGKLEESIEAYNNALAIKPDYAEAYNNMGTTLQDQGKLEAAIEAYNNALAIKPNYAGAKENFLTLQTQVQGTAFNTDTVSNQVTKYLNPKITKRPKYQIVNAISSFLSADQSQAHKHIKNFNASDQKLKSDLSLKDQVFCSAYNLFLSALLKEPVEKSPDFHPRDVIYHLGESHCLSYAHRNIRIRGTTFSVAPMITFGAKAFHFSKTKDDAFKAITKTNFASIPRGSKVFISFGEIDCRPNEGFLSAAAKLNKTIEELIASTVIGYLQWFAVQNKTQCHRLFFLNVPAPAYNKNYDENKNADVAKVVERFNAEIEKHLFKYSFNLIDVFKFTIGKDGFSNGLFHIDNYHLGPKALCEIEVQLNN